MTINYVRLYKKGSIKGHCQFIIIPNIAFSTTLLNNQGTQITQNQAKVHLHVAILGPFCFPLYNIITKLK